jgi:tRNA(Ile)-lysidine synthase
MKINLDFFNTMDSRLHGNRIAIAVSGGVDSMALLYLMFHESRIENQNIIVLHVNHKLRERSDTEEQYIIQTCEKLNIPYKIFHWTGDKPEAGLESVARDVRYKFMTDYCRENNIEYLAVAHQADDQIETFLMNLSRGSGVWGLGAIRNETVRDGVKIIRPLLNVSRADLIEYCKKNDIKYFNDEMNDDEKYTRVKIRKNRHLLRDKLGISDERILLAIKNLDRARETLDLQLVEKSPVLFKASFLFDAPMEIRLKLLGNKIGETGKNKYQPRLKSLEYALDKLSGNCKITLGGCILRRLGDDILIVPEGESASFIKLRKRKNNEQTKQTKKNHN